MAQDSGVVRQIPALKQEQRAEESRAANWYRKRALDAGALADAAEHRANRIGYLRLLVFLGLLLALLWLVTAAPGARLLATLTSVVAVAAFSLLVKAHRRAREASARHHAAREYHTFGQHRVARDWEALPEPPSAASEAELAAVHPYATDLDVAGRVSLIQLLDVTSRAPGRSTLLGWLLESAPSAGEIRERQTAARELAARDELREELGVLARMSRSVGPRTLERFAEWCESGPWLLERPVILWAGRIITAITVVALLLQLAGVLTWPLWAATATLGLFLIFGARAGLARAVKVGGVPSEQLRHHAAMLRLILDSRWESPRMERLRDTLRLSGHDAAGELARLERIVAFAEVRHSPMLHLALQWLFVWDVHVAAALEHWRRDAGVHVRGWLEALGEAESLAALGTLAHDNPEWCFPAITEGADDADAVVEGEGVGHPLLPDGARVSNDVALGPPGSFLLITGSNMSGKSTLLRAVGANVVLALAGAPVCAARFRTPPLDVRTSIRIQDSLERGISLFMAELQRLRAIVDAARAGRAGRRVLYLLDEMLHGTNTAERQIAARIVIGHLLRAGAIGAVTTHDLSLAAGGGLESAARPVHFSEQFDRSDGRTAMTFDYRLRPGLATSANALALLELVGLGASE
jgi:Mismatch repair ATPase (MutS family)